MISAAAQCLWAKKSRKDESLWLPLDIHLTDTAAIARRLWNKWLPQGVRDVIRADLDEDLALRLFVFLAAAHDIGKATPVFQAQTSGFRANDLDQRICERQRLHGLPIKPYTDFSAPKASPHALAGQLLLERAGLNRNAAVIIGSHHGKPPSDMMLEHGIPSHFVNYYLSTQNQDIWASVHAELIQLALDTSGFTCLRDVPSPSMNAQVLLSGLLIMADWIASNERFFPLMALDAPATTSDGIDRVRRGWERLALPRYWSADNTWMGNDLYQKRFGEDAGSAFDPNIVQRTASAVAGSIREPGILVIEAPMGMGKTEAALAVAEIFAHRSGRSGVFFALPTQATSNGIFPRIEKWVRRLEGQYAIRLLHGKAQFNENYRGLPEGGGGIGIDDDQAVFVHEWFEGQKKAMLADFVVGTIDQLLLSGLKQKHVMMRHLGLANKVVVIDECHAYDAYMSQYLEMALNWLGAYRVPVVVLSATLPAEKRKMVIDAYLNKNSAPGPVRDPLGRASHESPASPSWIANRAYPLISYTDGDQVLQRSAPCETVTHEVFMDWIEEGTIADALEGLLDEGGCVGIVLNTVERAQTLYAQLCARFGENVALLHSRFLSPDRAEKESKLLFELGRPGSDTVRPKLRVVVGTQVIEQSLDIDFDLLITDFCPMDLLLQRIGRLHRHLRPRPAKLFAPRCLMIGSGECAFDPGTTAVYGEYLLMRTFIQMKERIALPRDISDLIQSTYDVASDPSPLPAGYDKAKAKWKLATEKQRTRAHAFRVTKPSASRRATLINWLNTSADVTEKCADAAVRDTDASFEVLLIRQKFSGALAFLPWREGGAEISPYEIPSEDIAKKLAQQSVRLPGPLCYPDRIQETIDQLTAINSARLAAWQQSPWLRGELFLLIDEEGRGTLNGYTIQYDREQGLSYSKEVEPGDR